MEALNERTPKRAQLYIPLATMLSFNIIKEMQYFRRLLRIYPGDFLRSILPYFIKRVYEEEFDHNEFLYFPIINGQVDSSRPIDSDCQP